MELSYNIATHLVTKEQPFLMAYGFDDQPTNLAFKGAHSILEFKQDGEDLAKKCEQIINQDDQVVVEGNPKALRRANQCRKMQHGV